jgi:hypothetical protein
VRGKDDPLAANVDIHGRRFPLHGMENEAPVFQSSRALPVQSSWQHRPDMIVTEQQYLEADRTRSWQQKVVCQSHPEWYQMHVKRDGDNSCWDRDSNICHALCNAWSVSSGRKAMVLSHLYKYPAKLHRNSSSGSAGCLPNSSARRSARKNRCVPPHRPLTLQLLTGSCFCHWATELSYVVVGGHFQNVTLLVRMGYEGCERRVQKVLETMKRRA